jgi:hypothetical protein
VTDAGVAATRVTRRRLLISDAGIRGAISVLNCDARLLPGYFVREATSVDVIKFVMLPKFFFSPLPRVSPSQIHCYANDISVYVPGVYFHM